MRPKGMHPDAYAAYVKAFEDAGMKPLRVVQTCTGALQGRVAASAGTHDADGKLPSGESYSAAVDLSTWKIRGVLRWSEKSIKWALYNLARNGFVAWYRHTGSFAKNLHIHAIYVGVPMKPILRAQVNDFLNDRTGLKGHAKEGFWTANSDVDAALEKLYREKGHNH